MFMILVKEKEYYVTVFNVVFLIFRLLPHAM